MAKLDLDRYLTGCVRFFVATENVVLRAEEDCKLKKH